MICTKCFDRDEYGCAACKPRFRFPETLIEVRKRLDEIGLCFDIDTSFLYYEDYCIGYVTFYDNEIMFEPEGSEFPEMQEFANKAIREFDASILKKDACLMVQVKEGSIPSKRSGVYLCNVAK